jgi:hypothetical protein
MRKALSSTSIGVRFLNDSYDRPKVGEIHRFQSISRTGSGRFELATGLTRDRTKGDEFTFMQVVDKPSPASVSRFNPGGF